jgi:gamma-tubulin complex component 5
MDSRLPWADFHFLNSKLRDVLSSADAAHLNAELVQVSYRRSSATAVGRTASALDGLRLDYSVPFPLTYILGPHALAIYAGIFTLLLQIRRAKVVLERILIRGGADTLRSGADMKVFYVMRSRLGWFVK